MQKYMNKSKLFSAILAGANIILSVVYLNFEFAFFVSVFSLVSMIRLWYGYVEMGVYRMHTGKNFLSDSQARFISWFGLIFMLVMNIFWIVILKLSASQ
jgi:hypothetical protein